MRDLIRVATTFVLLLSPAAVQAGPITYQGRLYENGSPANGTYSMQFYVYDQEVGGQLLSGPSTVFDVEVVDGLFTTRFEVDDVEIAEAGQAWVEIFVSAGVGAERLSPRQPLDAPPLAQHAVGALKRVSGDVVLQREGAIQTVADTLGPPGSDVFFVNAVWQSFTATESGTIEDVWVQLSPSLSASTIRFTIYEGEGDTGAQLVSTNASPVGEASTPTFGASMPATVVAGQAYTVVVGALTGDGLPASFTIPYGTLGYEGGKANRQPVSGALMPNDYYFRVRIRTADGDTVLAGQDGILRAEGIFTADPGMVDLGPDAIQLSEIEGEPGVAVTPEVGEPDSITMTADIEQILLREFIDLPNLPGRVIVMFSASVQFSTNGASSGSGLAIAIREVGSTGPELSRAQVLVPIMDSGTWQIPIAVQGFDTVSGGGQAQYEAVVTSSNADEVDIQITQMRLHMFWMPTSYNVPE